MTPTGSTGARESPRFCVFGISSAIHPRKRRHPHGVYEVQPQNVIISAIVTVAFGSAAFTDHPSALSGVWDVGFVVCTGLLIVAFVRLILTRAELTFRSLGERLPSGFWNAPVWALPKLGSIATPIRSDTDSATVIALGAGSELAQLHLYH